MKSTGLTSSEWMQLVKGLKAIYARDNFLADEDTVKFWYLALRDIPYEALALAVEKWIATEKFPPTPAELRQFSSEVVEGNVPDWSSGWEEVMSALSKYGSWDIKGATESFSELTRETVKRLGGFKEICNCEDYTQLNVYRANFRDIYSALADREMVQRQMSKRLQGAINQMIEENNPKEIAPAQESPALPEAEERVKPTNEQILNFIKQYGYNPLGEKE